MPLSPADADRLAETFGLGAPAGPEALVGPVAAGHLGRIHRLTTATGRYAVKELLAPVPEAAAARDAAYQDAVRAAGVPMPAVVRVCDGSVTTTVRGTTVRCYAWVDVLGPTRRLDPVAVGTLLAAVHRVVVPARGPMPAWVSQPVAEATWVELLERLAAAGAPYAGRLSALLPAVLETASVVRPSGRLQTCHGDLWSDNVLSTPSGDLVVLDWENAGPGDVSAELAVVAYEFGVDDPDRIRALHGAYVASGGPGRLREPADLSTLVVQLHHVVVAGCEQWLAAYAVRDAVGCRAAEAWVREFLDEPLLPETLEMLLAAVR